MIHADRSTRALLYRLQMSSVDKLMCYFTFTVAVLLLLLCYYSLKSNVVVPPLENESIENLDDSKAGILNPGCVSRILRDYKPNVTKTSALYHHPNIVHYVMISTTPQYQLIFRDYMSMLSCYKFLKPEKIILHTNTDIVGPYWKSIQEWSAIMVEIHKIERVPTLAGVKVKHIEHEADYTKLQILQKYGGSIFDFDVIMINGTRWRKNQKTSTCILSIEGNSRKVSIGIISCIKGSLFVDAWLYKYHTDYRHVWTYNSATIPKSILEKSDSNSTCYNIYVDETITQDPNFNEVRRWVDENYSVNWKIKTAAHYYYRDLATYGKLKPDDRNELMLTQNSSLGELFRHVSNG